MPRTRRKQSRTEIKAPVEAAPVHALADTRVAEPIVEELEVPVGELQPGIIPQERELTPRQLAERVTVETAAYGLLLLVSFALRLIDLGARPLAGHEAA